MIVPSMTSKELVKEIFQDYESVFTKTCYLIQGLRREVVKSKSKHVHRVFDYRTKKNNNWKIIVDYQFKHPKHIAFVYFRDDLGVHGIRVDGIPESLTHYTPHFLSRYNERFVKLTSVSEIELLVRFIEDNILDAVKYIEKGNSLKRDFFCKFNDGVGLGDTEYFPDLGKELLHFRTFITDRMLYKDQLEHADRMNSLIKKYIQENSIDFQKRA